MNNISFYLRIYDENNFGFVSNSVNSILGTDILISEEEYEEFFRLQSEGKKFRLKESNTGKGLFDYIEEYIPIFKGVQLLKSETQILKEKNLQLELSFAELLKKQESDKLEIELALAKLRESFNKGI